MRNTFFLQLPDAWRCKLYYIAAAMLLSVLLIGTACPIYAEEIAPDSTASGSESAEPTPEPGADLAGNLTDAYDQYAGGLKDGLDGVKSGYDGLIDDSALQFAQAVTGWIPAEVWAVFGLSVASMVVLAILRYLRA